MIKNALKIIMILLMLLGITRSILNCVSVEKQKKRISNVHAVSKNQDSDKSKKTGDKKSGSDKSKKTADKKPGSEKSKKPADKKPGEPGTGRGVEGTMIVNPDSSIDCQGAPINC